MYHGIREGLGENREETSNRADGVRAVTAASGSTLPAELGSPNRRRPPLRQ